MKKTLEFQYENEEEQIQGIIWVIRDLMGDLEKLKGGKNGNKTRKD